VADEHLRGRVPTQGHDSREGNTYGVRSRDATTTKGQAGEAAQRWMGLATLAAEADEMAVK
jgi:hypothetical protein